MVLTASFVLLAIGLVVTVAGAIAKAIVASLISASRYQDHTTSPSAPESLVLRHRRVHRILPNVRDNGQRPFGRDGRSCRFDLPDALSELFLQSGLDTTGKSAGAQAPRWHRSRRLNSYRHEVG
jgi:hypothetical protein